VRSRSSRSADVVTAQAKAGLDIVNDGEFGKSSWSNYVLARLSGFEARPDSLAPATWLGRDRFRFAEFMASEFPRGLKGAPADACVAPIRYTDPTSIYRDTDNLNAALTSVNVAEGFLTTVAPASVGYDAFNGTTQRT
jgi:5-methyltetrahydropteroyltriglutamate--homocysteine methyltransferase